jgi:hypothetical protein
MFQVLYVVFLQVSFGAVDALSELSILDKGAAGGLNITHYDHFDALLGEGAIVSPSHSTYCHST